MVAAPPRCARARAAELPVRGAHASVALEADIVAVVLPVQGHGRRMSRSLQVSVIREAEGRCERLRILAAGEVHAQDGLRQPGPAAVFARGRRIAVEAAAAARPVIHRVQLGPEADAWRARALD